MDLKKILTELADCPCGRKHEFDIKAVEIGHGLKIQTAKILSDNQFPSKILVVADTNTLSASEGIIDILEAGGFDVKLKLYQNFREPHISFVNELMEESFGCGGILSVGTGSLNDICRLAAFRGGKDFAIFATAPSMDGFASGTAPIIENNIKSTLPARQPSIIIADTEILAAAPAELKSAGFGDVIGKLTAITDWRIAHLLIGEYYCERIASLVRGALSRLISMADRVCSNDEEAAGYIMEVLVLTGLAMKLADVSRPASGAEHMISHFWGMKKLERGEIADFHGKKVGVATLMLVKAYRDIICNDSIKFTEDTPDWEAIYSSYGESQQSYIEKMNAVSATEGITPELLKTHWLDIKNIIQEELPSYDELLSILKRAGAAVSFTEVGIDNALAREGLLFHPYMRHKVILSRLLDMTDASILSSFIL